MRFACAFLFIAGLCSCYDTLLSSEKRLQEANAILQALPRENELNLSLKEASGDSNNANSRVKVAELQRSFTKLFGLMENGRALSDYPDFVGHAHLLSSRAAETQYRIGIQSLNHQGSDPCIFVVTVNSAGLITDLRPVIWKS